MKNMFFPKSTQKYLHVTGTETVHKKDIYNAMSNFFCSVGKNLAKKFAPVPNPLRSGAYEVNKDKAESILKTIEVKDSRAAFAKIKIAKSFWD